jgi:hypothetical protein
VQTRTRRARMERFPPAAPTPSRGTRSQDPAGPAAKRGGRSQ